MTLSVIFEPYHFVHTILSNTILSIYHFVHTIMSVPFCPLPFSPRTDSHNLFNCLILTRKPSSLYFPPPLSSSIFLPSSPTFSFPSSTLYLCFTPSLCSYFPLSSSFILSSFLPPFLPPSLSSPASLFLHPIHLSLLSICL